MQFILNHKVGTDYLTVKFYDALFTSNVRETFKKLWQRIGGEYTEEGWKFPMCTTSEILEEIIRNTCFMCGGLMKDGVAFDNTYISFNDFGNDAGQRGTTMSKIGPAKQIKVRKCTVCGHSHT